MIWLPLAITLFAALHIGATFARFKLDDMTLVFALPLWGTALAISWGFWFLSWLTT